MTPKDKAKELVDNFSNEILLTINGGKVAALIAVDEVLKAAFYAKDEIYDFYIEVKQEIENL